MFNKKKVTWRILALMFAISLVAAACGSSDDDDTTAPPPAPAPPTDPAPAPEPAPPEPPDAPPAPPDAPEPPDAPPAPPDAPEPPDEPEPEPTTTVETPSPEPPPDTGESMDPPGLVDKQQGWVPPEATVENARAWPMAQTELPQLTIGYLQVLGASEAAQRLEFTAKDAVDYLGWDWEYCDAQGVPDDMQSCLAGFVASGVDAIVTDGTTVEAIANVLPSARAAGIPFVNTGGTQSFYHLYAASFNPNDYQHGLLLAQWMVDNAEKDGKVQVSSVNFAAWGVDRENALKEVIAGTGITIGDEEVIDFADAINGPAEAASRWLLQAPDSVAFWLTIDVAALGVGPVISQRFQGVSPPERPMVLTWYANCATQQQMLAGGVDASVEENLEWGSYVAMDQIAEYFANGKQFSDELRPYYLDEDGSAVQFSVPFIVTPSDADPVCEPGRGPYPTPDDPASAGFVDFFERRWAAAFSNVG